jgi:hypothetical protein
MDEWLQSTQIDTDFVDMIEQAFLEEQIDSENLFLAYIRLETNHPLIH